VSQVEPTLATAVELSQTGSPAIDGSAATQASAAAPTPPTSAAPPNRATAAEIELKPLEAPELAEAIAADFRYSRERAELHEVRAGRWDLTARWARFIVAMTAAISTLSLIADNIIVTTIFSIITAVIAAINAAFDPSATSALHRQSAKEYQLLSRKLGWLSRRLDPYATPFSKKQIDTSDLETIYRTYLEHRIEVDAANERAPAINRLRKDREQIDGPPRLSWWMLHRAKRQGKLQRKMREEFYRSRAQEDALVKKYDR
jgi:hypothetical protein